MADEANTPVAMDATKTVEEDTRPTEAVAEPAVADAEPAEDGAPATPDAAEGQQSDAAQEDTPAEDDATADAKDDTAAASNDADATPATESVAANGTPAPKKSNNSKRKSGAGVPEHKKKTPSKKKKATPDLRLDAEPGDMYMVAMRGYQPWPVIVCDDDMLPESLLAKRPVSAKNADGSYRADFLEGGKNAKDRRYPVMFLGTNEFAWQVNTELLTFDIEEVKKDVESGNQAKKNKALWQAYQTAAEGHDLEHFKQMLSAHEAAMAEDIAQQETKEQEKKEKAAKRKSQPAGESDDVDMEDAGDDAAPSAKKGKAKATKKRKKDEESDGENEKPAKTPKAKLKINNNKTPKEPSAAKPKKETKSKKKASEEAEPAQPEEPPMTEEERIQKREKQVLYLRHRLQKGFLSRDQQPKDEDMDNMSDYLKQLELHDDLEAEVIKKTKVHKVLKAIIKLEGIPKEEEFEFKKRSTDLLNKWGGALAADTDAAPEAATNGAKETSEPAKEETPAAKESEEKTEEDTSAEPAVVKTAEDGDVAMADADKESDKDTSEIKVDTTGLSKDDAEVVAQTETSTA
ncbi:hypothetical protein P153DRAFT_382328 [Dothidotthia symphoricarpi CBS 119687]|uniref:PWWP domain-containing protein n=1 Tax=Dothidotthia symphoricarpi CBS 119687 TaxID=1392245 RepID=A0A6A6AL87_9PLEO|nr:uncharacterized protein P153DRAFT_382328 [Dothidotthia symphoricarpi CBS 119687]KAF2132709.1 hypothetical protein P153DRAFT_382328 [Dothidotthia symphoricarpi CBS 119687]